MKRITILTILVLAAASTGLAQIVPLEVDPFWLSGPANNSYSLAVADLNLDGYLDLIFANFTGNDAIYYNNRGTIQSIPSTLNSTSSTVAAGDINGDGFPDAVFGGQGNHLVYINHEWKLPQNKTDSIAVNSNTYQLALCDIDGDGDLDLAVANYGEPNRVYLNSSGVFSDTPFWTSSLSARSTSVEAGDINGDGHLDLVFGNFEEANTVYTGYGDSISASTTWQSDSTKITWEIALGDVNGDGLLDLLCANKGELILAQENYLYLNEGSSFATSPSWVSTQAYNSSGAELADIDGDGDLDAIFGNTDQANTVYLNISGTLATDPAWYSNPANRTYIAAPIDVESDGDLDIAFVNSGDYPDGERNTIFRNTTAAFSQIPIWTSPDRHNVRSIEYFDVDSDGDLDLALGCDGQPNVLYLNENGMLQNSPSWSSASSAATFSIVSGDVDGDGDADLVCGNHNGPDVLYINDGGVLRADQSWSSSGSMATWSVTLADFDSDGDLDLGCGHYGQANTVYYNTGGTFQSDPAWESTPSYSTWAITSGDINGDGLMDLICGNAGLSGQPNCVYLQGFRGLETDPAWYSAQENQTWSLALGDVDGDGDLDLACGNIGQHNTLYINDGASLSSDPAWSSSSLSATRALAFEDVDGDGDLDLACGNYLQQDNIYFNSGLTLWVDPGWSSASTGATCDISIVDTDLDGDPDLTSGLYNEPVTVLGGLAAPSFRGDPLAPTGQRAQNSAFMRRAKLERTGENLFHVEFDLVDVESDPVYVRTAYRYRSETEPHPVDFSGQPTPIGPLASSPEGTRHSFDWDVTLLPLDNRDVTLLLTVIEIPTLVSNMRHMPVYRLETGSIQPVRPVITVSSEYVEFPRVTVGDTVSAKLAFGNTGNAPLVISSVTLPSPDMRVDITLPDTLTSLHLGLWDIYLEAVPGSQVNGPVVIESNDPVSPVTTVEVIAPIIPLAVSSRPLKPEGQDEVEPDEALTVIVTPDLWVRVETGTLSYRIIGDTEWTVLPLSPSQDDFIAIIPGGDVTEAGLEYYIEVRNDPAVSTDPEGAPGDSLFTVNVIPPEWVTAMALENSSEGYMDGREIRVQASLQPGTVVSDGKVHFRKVGDRDYIEIPLELELDPPSALIPNTIVTAAGVEYWLEVNTLTRTLTSPATDPAMTPEALRVTVPNLEDDRSWQAEKYRIFSVPLAFSDDFTGTIEALLSDQKEFGPYDPIKWRSFTYLTSTGKYVELSETNAEHFRPHPGRAFWLVSRSNSRIDTSPVTGYSTPSSGPWQISLSPGWNMTGHPFSFPVEWDSMIVDTMSMDEAEMVLVEPPVYYSGSGYRYDNTVLDPFSGYWINNLTDSNVTLLVPPVRHAPQASAPQVSELAGSDEGWTIRVGISAQSSGAEDLLNSVGIYESSAKGFDRMDRSCAPPGPGRSITVYFPGNDGSHLCRDIRGGFVRLHSKDLPVLPVDTPVSGEIWLFDIAKNFPSDYAADEVVLSFDVEDFGNRDIGLFLIDRELNNVTDLREIPAFSFYSGRREFISHPDEARFLLLAGTDEFVEDTMEDITPPVTTALTGNYPNPFNPVTVIRYDIAEPCMVTIRIFDIRGALVKTLMHEKRKPGRHEEAWDGRTGTGMAASSGIFFCLMETDKGFRDTRKLILLR